MDKNMSNKRKSNRIQTNIKVVFFCDYFQYTGIAINCSESGMCIDTLKYISPDRNIKIILPLHEEELTLTGMPKRTVKSDNLPDAIGVELLSPPPEYFNFIQNLQLSL
jgi:hypothetical protein